MRALCLLSLMLVVFASCTHKRHHARPHRQPQCDIDLDSIVRRGTLRVVTDYNSINYFVYKGVPVGYQYEMLTEYCRSLGVRLDLSVSNDNDLNEERLLRGDIDLIATSLCRDSTNTNVVFTEPYGQSRQVLVQRSDIALDSVVRTEADLNGKTICVLAHSFYEDFLLDLSSEHDDSIDVEAIADYDVEQLIQLVAENEIDYAVSLENIALVNNWFYPNLNIDFALSDVFELSWAVRPNAPRLINDINAWMQKFKRTSKMKVMYKKYNVDHRELAGGRIGVGVDTYRGDFAEIIRRECDGTPFDWLLVSSVICQESRFNPDARSWAGAVGLMQLMPETARRFGVDDLRSPEQNIRAGIKFLCWIDKRFQKYVPSAQERLKFVLASYNVGIGHVMDAIRLAEKFKKNPEVWDENVSLFLLNKSNPAYYTDEVVKHGYCRGSETYLYVRNVMTRYRNYRAANIK